MHGVPLSQSGTAAYRSRASVRWPLLLSLFAIAACSSEKPSAELPPGVDGPVFNGDNFGDPDNPDLGAGDGVGDGESCVGQTAGTESLPSVLQLVVDTSGSMDQDAPGSNNSKWVITRRALLQAIEGMPPETSIGVVFYPDVPIDDRPLCFDEDTDVEIARLDAAGSRQRNAIARAFQNQSPDGGTPTHDAYRYAFQELEQSDAPGSRFLVVITDGTPTFSLGCEGTGLVSDPVDPSPLVTEAASASARGLSTFVIGSPGSEGARESLSRMAEAGGTAASGCSHDGPNYCHFDMTEEQDFATALNEALGTISGLALSCSYDIPAPPGGLLLDPEKVNVLFTSAPGEEREIIARSDAQNCSDGWRYSENGQQVLLCPSTCERVRESQGTLELQFGCTTRVR